MDDLQMGTHLNVISLGAGVQSSAMLLMAEKGDFGRPPDAAIFADTGWEPQKVYNYLEFLEKKSSIPIHRVSTGNLKEAIEKAIGTEGTGHKGQPPFFVKNFDGDGKDRGGMLWRKCTTDYKVRPIIAKIRELLGCKKRIRKGFTATQWIGISLDEAHRMRSSRNNWLRNRYPLIEKRITRAACLEWLKKMGFPEPPKSSCLGCPYHSDAHWRNIKRSSPEEWKETVSFDQRLRMGGKLPGVKGEAFVHRKMIPLKDVDLSTDEDRGQTEMFGNECEGLCGV